MKNTQNENGHPSWNRLMANPNYINNISSRYKKVSSIIQQVKITGIELMESTREGKGLQARPYSWPVTKRSAAYHWKTMGCVSDEYVNRLLLDENDRKVRRAKKDKKYFDSLVEELLPKRAENIEEALKYYGDFKKRNEIREILFHADLSLNTQVFEHNTNVTMVRSDDLSKLKSFGFKIIQRGKNWRVFHSMETNHYHVPGETTWRNRKAVSYSRAENNNYVRSFVLIHNEYYCQIDINKRVFNIKLDPSQNFRFSIDDLGPKISSGKDDYHFLVDDIVDSNYDEAEFVRLIKHKLEENAINRKDMETKYKVYSEVYGEVYIGINDSYKAGNCKAGTHSFIEKNKLDPRKHYKISNLLEIFKNNVEFPRLKLAISAAIMRHKKEMEQGYSFLSDHITNV